MAGENIFNAFELLFLMSTEVAVAQWLTLSSRRPWFRTIRAHTSQFFGIYVPAYIYKAMKLSIVTVRTVSGGNRPMLLKHVY